MYNCLTTVDITQKSCQKGFVDGLECDSNNVAHKLPDRVIEAADPRAQLWHRVGARPELLEVAALQNVSQVHNAAHLRILQLQQMTSIRYK